MDIIWKNVHLIHFVWLFVAYGYGSLRELVIIVCTFFVYGLAPLFLPQFRKFLCMHAFFFSSVILR